MFHSLYSKASRQACDYYRDASLRLRHLQPEVALGAVDCYRKPEQGGKFQKTFFYRLLIG